MTDASLEAAVRRIYHRYVTEFVEAFSFCPWAQKTRETGRVGVQVTTEKPWCINWASDAYRRVVATQNWDIGILIFPRFKDWYSAFMERVSELRQTVEQAYPVGHVPLVMAPFHPDADADVTTVGRLTSFIRRSPDPTIQLVRASTLADVRSQHGSGTDYIDLESTDLEALLSRPPSIPLHERIAAQNMDKVQETGVSKLEVILHAIAEDRRAAYAPFTSS